jgi:release factor glutamine methyltransferase
MSDISPDSVALARENAALNGVDVEILQGDLLEPFRGRKANYLVCNPPYITTSEYFTLDPSVRDFEPKGALVGGDVGTEYYSRLKRDLDPFLEPKATCFFEIGSGQGESIKKIFENTTNELILDWAGHPRFFFLERQ